MVKYFYIPNINKLIVAAIVLLNISSTEIFPQINSVTNLEKFYSLTDSITNQIADDLPENKKSIYLELNLGSAYSLFEGRIRSNFSQRGIELYQAIPQELNVPMVNIVFEGAGVEYGDIFRDGWFGSHYVPRHAVIFGTYYQSFSDDGLREFEMAAIDTVKVEDVKELENENFPFTQGNIPSEPFLSGLVEPLVAIGVAAAVVILFFSIRSK